MAKHKKMNKIKIIIIVFVIIMTVMFAVFGRYVANNIKEAYFTSREFYFTSDMLTLYNATYQYENWGGVDNYEINFNLYSYINSLLRINYDLDYWVSCETEDTDKVTIGINEADGPTYTTGTIYAKIAGEPNNISKLRVVVTPNSAIKKDEIIKVKIKAGTEEPYKKEISCEVSLRVKQVIVNSYTIEDVPNRDYAILKIVNAQSTGSPVTVKINTDLVRLDLSDDAYVNRQEGSEKTDLNGYIKQFTFNMEKESVEYIKFYKVDTSQDYTYPSGDKDAIVTVGNS